MGIKVDIPMDLFCAIAKGDLEAAMIALEAEPHLIDTPIPGIDLTDMVRENIRIDLGHKHRLEKGLTPLGYAVFIGELKITQFLIEKGANINIPSLYGCHETPLMIACMLLQDADEVFEDPEYVDNSLNMVKLLVENGANINDEAGGQTALIIAMDYNNNHIARYLIEKGADILLGNLPSDPYGGCGCEYNAVAIAANNRDWEFVQYLIGKINEHCM